MRVSTIVAAPLLAVLSAMPAAAQVSARIHVGARVVRPVRVDARPRGVLTIGAYAPSLFGTWEDYSQYWEPVTAYYYDGAYYDYPIVEYATPVDVYRYNGRLFFPPRDRAVVQFRSRPSEFVRPREREIVGRYPEARTYREAPRAAYAARGVAPRENGRAFAPRAGEYRGSAAPGPRERGADNARRGSNDRSNGRGGH